MNEGAVLTILTIGLCISTMVNIILLAKVFGRKKYKNITKLPTVVQAENIALHKVVSTFAKNYNGGKSAAVRMASRYDEN